MDSNTEAARTKIFFMRRPSVEGEPHAARAPSFPKNQVSCRSRVQACVALRHRCRATRVASWRTRASSNLDDY
jgi:hypothetical protein